ncbi:MAG: ribosomal protein S18-alanine N-acetyltransferase [Lyngbya sp. HA4199-MV5]|nr:ribosomal protein S18-alanine N-acetyltransferase [Lyngbya sp. HA4199-MV5]
MWTLEGYRRELESPNSELLVFVEKGEGGREAEGRGQRAEGGAEGEGEAGEAGEAGDRGEERGVRSQESEVRMNSKLSSAAAQSTTQNSKLKTHNSKLSSPTPHSPLPTPHFSPPPLLGLGCYWAILEEAHITMLAIDPAYQGQGLGQALLVALMSSAYDRGLERATLEVRVSNQAAVSLYQKFGFREAGRRRRYYPDNGEDALVLWRGGLQYPEFPGCLADWQRQVDDRLHQTGLQVAMERDHLFPRSKFNA